MSDSPRSPPWYRIQFSLGTLLWLTLVVAMATAWWIDRRKFEARLQKLEQSSFSPYQQKTPMWTAADILGAPDDPSGTAGKSWCPKSSQGAAWVEVGFDRAVVAATIDLYETYSIGRVQEVLVIDASGREESIWKGTDPTTGTARAGVFAVPVPQTIKSVKRVKIVVEGTSNSPWPCLDAVGLTTASRKTAWASSCECSSVYSGDLTATSQRGFWSGWW